MALDSYQLLNCGKRRSRTDEKVLISILLQSHIMTNLGEKLTDEEIDEMMRVVDSGVGKTAVSLN